MIKIKLQQAFVNLFFYLAPSFIFIWRHIDLTARETVSIAPYILAGLAIGVGMYFMLKKKNKIMKIREVKEIEDNKRKVGTIIYFYSKFVAIFLLIFVLMYYVQFNFSPLIGTLEMIGGSLLLGALIRINLAINSGY